MSKELEKALIEALVAVENVFEILYVCMLGVMGYAVYMWWTS